MPVFWLIMQKVTSELIWSIHIILHGLKCLWWILYMERQQQLHVDELPKELSHAKRFRASSFETYHFTWPKISAMIWSIHIMHLYYFTCTWPKQSWLIILQGTAAAVRWTVEGIISSTRGGWFIKNETKISTKVWC